MHRLHVYPDNGWKVIQMAEKFCNPNHQLDAEGRRAYMFSDHRDLPEPDKALFFQARAEIISHAGGVAHRKYETFRLLARKV